MSTRTVLLTRPRTESEKLAPEIRARGLEVFIEPMLEIVPLEVQIPDLTKFQAIVFTSTNGVDTFCRRSSGGRQMPVFTVGNTTQERARTHGFHNIKSAGSDNTGLQQVLAGAGLIPNIPVLHVCGVHTAGVLAVPGIPVERLMTYRADKTASLSHACLNMLDKKSFFGALFYSRRTAENFTELIRIAGSESRLSTIKALCISAAVVECLRCLPWQSVQAADTPTTSGMMRMLDGLVRETGTHTGGRDK